MRQLILILSLNFYVAFAINQKLVKKKLAHFQFFIIADKVEYLSEIKLKLNYTNYFGNNNKDILKCLLFQTFCIMLYYMVVIQITYCSEGSTKKNIIL